MTIDKFKEILSGIKQMIFVLPNGSYVPPHSHITEIGYSIKNFIDCGGTLRKQSNAVFQLWSADDYDHRLDPKKVVEIIEVAEQDFELGGLEIEIEHQSETIGRYGISYDVGRFILTPTKTDCLAKKKCGITDKTDPISHSSQNACNPSLECC